MKQIKVNPSKYLEAPIDDKNVMSDSLIENLFDDGSYVWDRNEAMGFIAGYPCYVHYDYNCLDIECCKNPSTAEAYTSWSKAVIERVTGGEEAGKLFLQHDKNIQHITILDDDINKECDEAQLISSFWMSLKGITVYFHWNQKK